MADIPTPRSYSEILGDLIEAFLSRYGLRALKVGSPVLSMFESVAQSQLRCSNDTFDLLEAINLDSATGVALDRIGQEDGLVRFPQSPASGSVTVSDSSFAKLSTKVFQGTPAPIVGSAAVNVLDATGFPASGSVYIGRGTSNYEGPIAYTSILPPGISLGQSGGSYYTLVLSSATTKFHNLGEPVVVAQGGNRQVNAGTLVQTSQGNAVAAVQFRVLYSAQLPDGEVEIQNVQVTALKPGTTGNVIKGALNSFSTPPFSGATVANPNPINNGLAAETDESFRERIRVARSSRARGTATAIEGAVLGITAPDEPKRVLSASIVTREGTPTTLYVDDGTGYEERDAGTAIEVFTDQALGGEDFFKVSKRPVAKAYVLTTVDPPFTLVSGAQLAFTVGGVTTTHTFSSDEFRAIQNATAYEVAASVNRNAALNWSLRTYDSGQSIAAFAKAERNESIELAVPVGVDANQWLGFPAGRADTLRLYLNDRLLTKDGSLAKLQSEPLTSWGAMSAPEDLELQVDGAPLANLVSGTFTFTDQDFVDAGTGYTTLGRNSLAAWAAVLEHRIPGISVAIANGRLELTSNRGLTGRASLRVAGGSLVAKAMFAAGASTGANSDFTLDRQTGELRLAQPLTAGDQLSAGSTNTRGFLQTPRLTSVNVLDVAGAHWWFTVDAAPEFIATGISTSSVLTGSVTSKAWGVRQRLTGTSGIFTNVQVGDWILFWDPSSPSTLKRLWFRIAAANQNDWIEFDHHGSFTGSATFTSAGVVVVRTKSGLQEINASQANGYTSQNIVPVLNFQLRGATAAVYRTAALRVRTNTQDTSGDVTLVASDADASRFQLPVAQTAESVAGHLASVISGNAEAGTPNFLSVAVGGSSGDQDPVVTLAPDHAYGAVTPRSDLFIEGRAPYPDGPDSNQSRYGNTRGFQSAFESVAPDGPSWDLTLRIQPEFWLVSDRAALRAPYAIGPNDSLGVLIDQDTEQKRFVIPMWRRLKPVGTTYGTTNTFRDADNGNQSLAKAFGSSDQGNTFEFADFAVYMKSRAKTHNAGNTFSSLDAGGAYSVLYNTPHAQPDLNRAVLWRYYRLGPDGNNVRLRYVLPQAEDLPVAVSSHSERQSLTDVDVQLASGNLCTGYPLPDNYPVGTVAISTVSGLTKIYYILGYKVLEIQRTSNVVRFKLQLPAGVKHTGLDLTGATNYYFVSTDPNLTTQDVSFTSETESSPGNGFDQVFAPVTGPNFGPDANPGTLYLLASTVANLSGSSPALARGDFLHVDAASGLDGDFTGYAVRIQNDPVADPLTIQAVADDFQGELAVNPTPTYGAVGNSSFFKVYKNPAQTAATIVTAVNALSGAPVTATLLGTGATKIDRSSYEDAASSVGQWVSLTDGVNYVLSTSPAATQSGDYQLTFKDDVGGTLTTSSDWANEEVRVVPRTARNVVDWLSQPAVTGLFSVAEVSAAGGGDRVQILSKTPGSAGSVQVQGGGANAATAAVVGAADLVETDVIPTDGGRTDYRYAPMVVTIRSAEAEAIYAGTWVRFDNASSLPLRDVIKDTTVLESITSVGTDLWRVRVDNATDFFTATATGAQLSATFLIERQGNFVCLQGVGPGTLTNLTSVREGDWLRIGQPATTTYAGTGGNGGVTILATGNVGYFRVVRVVLAADAPDSKPAIFIENSSAVEQPIAECDIHFYRPNSVMPGDLLSISTSLWDGTSSNRGVFEVVVVGDSGTGEFVDPSYVTVRGSLSPVTSPTAALGSSYTQVQILEGSPARGFKQVLGASQNSEDPDLTDLKLWPSGLYDRVGASAGSVLTTLDKLDFPTDVAQGADGYHYATGLIAEANKVLYGVSSDKVTYPGYAAAGASIDIAAALIRKVTLTILLRVRTGVNKADVAARVRSALAAAVNSSGLGGSVALSDLTKVAGRVGGVVSATMVSPLANVGSDLLAAQPYERLRVLNPDQDITVSFTGE